MATHELIQRMMYLGILSRPDVDLTYDKLDAFSREVRSASTHCERASVLHRLDCGGAA